VSTPTGIQRERSKGSKMKEGAIYVGRPSRWRNPYKIEKSVDGRDSLTGGNDMTAMPESIEIDVAIADCGQVTIWIRNVITQRPDARSLEQFNATVRLVAWTEHQESDVRRRVGEPAVVGHQGVQLARWMASGERSMRSGSFNATSMISSSILT
jgi:hypothetical protein